MTISCLFLAWLDILAHLNTVGGDPEGDHLLSLPGMGVEDNQPVRYFSLHGDDSFLQ